MRNTSHKGEQVKATQTDLVEEEEEEDGGGLDGERSDSLTHNISRRGVVSRSRL